MRGESRLRNSLFRLSPAVAVRATGLSKTIVEVPEERPDQSFGTQPCPGMNSRLPDEVLHPNPAKIPVLTEVKGCASSWSEFTVNFGRGKLVRSLGARDPRVW